MENSWKEDYSFRFDELRQHRVEASFYKYGSAKKNFGTYKSIDALGTLQLCIEKYKNTGNTEYLVDAANYCMFEFMFPSIEKAFFKATDSNESAGLVGFGINQLEEDL